ncbi:uncharacterized protein N7477_002137 [Penicillium maclennaniae]|uniref:uncharacterized protein n=1 Tax=Penicillium maclennaniae TaxID=1343394 RepID=UPI002540F8D1|nr:uncharacterized protein N7477_002137 [Penicillium maclennaniae]KAJ5676504.1 hypothetical protein N7477_002137 [Penicillium maclennaniae]
MSLSAPSTGLHPLVAPEARLTIKLHGKSEASMILARGMNHRDYFGQFNLIDSEATTQILLANKPLHVEPASKGTSWPFALTIPATINHESLIGPRTAQRTAFLPLNPEEVAVQLLPSAFRSKGFRSGIGAFVEYILEAELELQERGKTKTSRAAMPLQVQQFLTEPPITDFQLKRHSDSRKITSQRLIPGLKDSGLSFTQMAQQFIGSSKLPNFSFKVHVEMPTRLQVENTNYMPLRIGIEPIWNHTSEIIHDVPQKIKLESLVMRLKLSMTLESGDLKACDSQEIELISSAAVRGLSEEVFMSWGTMGRPDSKSRPEIEFIDVGGLLDFRLGRYNLGKVYPSFTTYNIKLTHQLSWEIRGVFDDEKIKMTASHDVTVLPPSYLEEEMLLTEDPPPSFAESQMTREVRGNL